MLDTLEQKNVDFTHLKNFDKFAQRMNSFGVDLYMLDSSCTVLKKHLYSTVNRDENLVREIASENLALAVKDANVLGDTQSILALNLFSKNQLTGTIVLDTCKDLKEESADSLSANFDLFKELLNSFSENIQLLDKSNLQLEMVSGELAQTYEELVLLYKMSTNMKFTKSEANYLQIACDNLTDLIRVEGIAILLEKEVHGHKQMVLKAGSGIIRIDHQMRDTIELAVAEEVHKGNDVLLDSNVDGPFKYNWPKNIRSILAVPLEGNDHISGVMVAVNRLEKPDFDSIDGKIFKSVAHECAVFIENGRLFKDLKDLFVGALKALTNSIDAKDQYTRGHSERVAFMSHWIAERLVETGQYQLSEDDIHRIYLAGLLHDIGKIGIDEKVLRKDGSLEEDEWKQIQSHPSIGASILTDIKQMKDIIPGVLSHHERYDGRGYPNGLKGEQIPLIARIVNVADSFDAMISKRVYRDALGITKAVSEIKKGLGTQFDEVIGRVFLESDLKQLWNLLQDGFIETWDYSNFSEYGTEAVGTLVK